MQKQLLTGACPEIEKQKKKKKKKKKKKGHQSK